MFGRATREVGLPTDRTGRTQSRHRRDRGKVYLKPNKMTPLKVVEHKTTFRNHIEKVMFLEPVVCSQQINWQTWFNRKMCILSFTKRYTMVQQSKKQTSW